MEEPEQEDHHQEGPAEAEDERSAYAGGLNAGLNVMLFDDFEAADSLDDWTVTTGPGFHNCGEWALSSNPSRRPLDGSGQFAMAFSLNCGAALSATSASLDSPAVDLDISGLLAASLEVDVHYTHGNGDTTTIEVWDGNGWVVIWNDPNANVNQKLVLDITIESRISEPGGMTISTGSRQPPLSGIRSATSARST